MVAAADIASAVEEFLRAPKHLVGADVPIPWADGRNDHEMVIHLPLEVNGEQSGAKINGRGVPTFKGP
jgi:hypothetical protein